MSDIVNEVMETRVIEAMLDRVDGLSAQISTSTTKLQTIADRLYGDNPPSPTEDAAAPSGSVWKVAAALDQMDRLIGQLDDQIERLTNT